jgi:hypothetical protein
MIRAWDCCGVVTGSVIDWDQTIAGDTHDPKTTFEDGGYGLVVADRPTSALHERAQGICARFLSSEQQELLAGTG